MHSKQSIDYQISWQSLVDHRSINGLCTVALLIRAASIELLVFRGGGWFHGVCVYHVDASCINKQIHRSNPAAQPFVCLSCCPFVSFVVANTISSPPPSPLFPHNPFCLPRLSFSPLHLSPPCHPAAPPPPPHSEFVSSSDPTRPELLSVPIWIGHSWCWRRKPSAITTAVYCPSSLPVCPRHTSSDWYWLISSRFFFFLNSFNLIQPCLLFFSFRLCVLFEFLCHDDCRSSI